MDDLGVIAPGFLHALTAVQGVSRQQPLSYAEIVTIALSVARPHVQAETLADLADEIAETYPAFADLLDQMSHHIRTALEGT